MTDKDFRDCKSILCMEYNKDVKKASQEKRNFNIEQFSKLEKKGLKFQNLERKLLLHTTKNGEKVFIQYPGKETIVSSPEKLRPWDFRPKLQLSNGSYIKDLSFPDIWDDLTDIHSSDKTLLSILAGIFFRMAFMYGYTLIKDNYHYEDINSIDNTVKTGVLSFQYYKPVFSEKVLNHLSSITPRGVSLEAYLVYNDLLVQNEDCKYYYRATQIMKQAWDSKNGRYNTLLSHISVIEYLQERLSFSQIMTRFQRGMGVAPIRLGDISDITQNIILKQ
ncbi:MAG: hypothetical protein J6J35_00210 [Alphaproteobacteria bacterium]|nr:hypothetical protein [Alphaproteobacteria bacterium]